MRKTFLPFFKPNISNKEIEEVVNTLKSGWLTAGPKTKQFEDKFAKHANAKHAIGVLNGTIALYLALLACKIKQNSEIITTPLTFCATANVIEHINCKPIFVDVSRSTGNIYPENIKKSITNKTGVILPVHLYGQPCDMDFIKEIADANNLKIVEDAAHCVDTSYKGKMIGSISDFTCFSFYANKNITTGEGGMITTDDDTAADFLISARLHGLSKGASERYKEKKFSHYQIIFPGYNFTIFDIISAIGIHQLERLDEFQKRRREIWNMYNREFSKMKGVILLKNLSSTTKHGMHLYTILVDINNLKISRDDFIRKLRELNIGTGLHYEALHLQPYYREKYRFRRGDFPNAEFISDRTVSLPLYPFMSDEDVNDVISAVESILKKNKL